MMTSPSYVGRQTVSNTGIRYSTVSVASWTALQPGDVLIVAAIHNWFPGYASLATAGYTLLGWQSVGGSSMGNPTLYVWGKIIGDPASEPAITVDFGNHATDAGLVVEAWRGGDPATILDGAVTTSYGNSSVTTPETSTSVDGSRVVHYTVFYAYSGAITGSSPYNVAVDAQFNGGNYGGDLRFCSFSKVQTPAGATGSATAAGPSGTAIGILVPLKAGPPRGAVSEGATLGATGDAVQAEVGAATAAVAPGVAADWTYADGAGEGTQPSAVHPGSTQDAVQTDAGGQTAAASMGVAADAVQAEVASATAAASFGAATAEKLADLGGQGAPAALGVTPDASYTPAGVVAYPGPDTWQVTLDGIGPDPVEVRITDNLGSTLVVHLNENGIVPEPDNVAAQLGASADAGYWTPGQTTEAARLGSTQDARQVDQGAVAAPVALGTQSDAQVLPPLVSRWLAKLLRIGQSWLGGPYRRVPLEQSDFRNEKVTASAKQDAYFTPKDAVDSGPDVAVAVGATQDAVFHIIEPTDVCAVLPIPRNVFVAPSPANIRAAPIRGGAMEVAPIPGNIMVNPIPNNIIGR
jgi:hypothetical protein